MGALVLHSPLMSGMRVAFPDTRRTWCFDAFPSIEKIPRVRAPTLVIHGTEDEVSGCHQHRLWTLTGYQSLPLAGHRQQRLPWLHPAS